MKYAVCSNGEWFIDTVEMWDTHWTSIALNGDGNPHIIYAGKYAYKKGGWTIIECPAGLAGRCSIALDPEGISHITYSGWYIRRIGENWLIENAGGDDASLTLDLNNNPHITYPTEEPHGMDKQFMLHWAFIDDVPPTADAGPDKTIKAGEAVTFGTSGSSDNWAIVRGHWNSGDGDSGEFPFQNSVSHTYKEAGTYTVTLTVKDAAGNTATNTAKITVEAVFPLWIVSVIAVVGIIGRGYIIRRRKV